MQTTSKLINDLNITKGHFIVSVFKDARDFANHKNLTETKSKRRVKLRNNIKFVEGKYCMKGESSKETFYLNCDNDSTKPKKQQCCCNILCIITRDKTGVAVMRTFISKALIM